MSCYYCIYTFIIELLFEIVGKLNSLLRQYILTYSRRGCGYLKISYLLIFGIHLIYSPRA
jgi:hypothetical protein